jgi:hypothetical protein
MTRLVDGARPKNCFHEGTPLVHSSSYIKAQNMPHHSFRPFFLIGFQVHVAEKKAQPAEAARQKGNMNCTANLVKIHASRNPGSPRKNRPGFHRVSICHLRF